MRAAQSYRRVRPYKITSPGEIRTLIVYEMDRAYGRPLEAQLIELDPIQFIIYTKCYSFVNVFYRYIGK